MVGENVCLYRKFGHCKFFGTCKLKHIETICENLNCDIESCNKRHPRDCRFFRDFARCKFGDYCSFKHRRESNPLTEDIENLKAKVENLEKLIGEKDEQIKRILYTIENMTTEKAFVNDEIVCETLSENENKLEKAKHQVDTELNFTYSCKECEKQFVRESDLSKHIKSNHPVKYHCDVCWLPFESERGMRNHFRSLHQPLT